MTIQSPNHDPIRSGRRARARRGARGSMLIMCLGIIVALLLMATAFLAMVNARRDASQGQSNIVYSQTAADAGENIALYLIESRYTLQPSGLAVPFSPVVSERGLDGVADADRTTAGAADDAEAFLQPTLYVSFDAPSGLDNARASGTGILSYNASTNKVTDTTAFALWSSLSGNRDATYNGGTRPATLVPFNDSMSWQHPLQPKGLTLTGTRLANSEMRMGLYDRDMKPLDDGDPADDAWYEQRARLFFQDLSGCIPFGWAGMTPAETQRMTALILGMDKFEAEIEKGALTSRARFKPFAAMAGGVSVAEDLLGVLSAANPKKYPAPRTMEEFAPLVVNNVTKDEFPKLFASGALAEFCPPAWALRYRTAAPFTARFHQLRNVAGEVLQTPPNNVVDKDPYFLVNANSASRRTLAALHYATHAELHKAKADGGAKEYIETLIRGGASDFPTPDTEVPPDVSAFELITDRIQEKVDEAPAPASVKVDAASIETVVGAIGQQYANAVANAGATAGVTTMLEGAGGWARRMHWGAEKEDTASPPADPFTYAGHRRLYLWHDPVGTATEKIGRQLGQTYQPTLHYAVKEVSAGVYDYGLADLLNELPEDTGGTAPLFPDENPVLVVKATYYEKTDNSPAGMGAVTREVRLALSWEDPDNVLTPWLPCGELLWGIRHPHRSKVTGETTGGAYEPIPEETWSASATYPLPTYSSRRFTVRMELASEIVVINAAGVPTTTETPHAALTAWPAVAAPILTQDNLVAIAENTFAALHDFEGNLFTELKKLYSPVARLFINQPGAAYRVLVRGELYDRAKQETVAKTDREFIYQPRYKEAEFAVTSPAITLPYAQYLPAYGRVAFRRDLP